MTPPNQSISYGTASSSLLDQVRQGDDEAWRRMATVYGPLVYRWVRQAGVPQDGAADVAQEVFVSVARYIDRFRRDRPGDSFRAWLRTISRNRLADYFRKMRSQPQARGGTSANLRLQNLVEIPPEEDDDSVQNEIREIRFRALLALKDRFKEQVWEAFWRTVVLQKTPGEVAQELETSVWAVYKAKARVLQRLRQELADL